MKDVLVKLEGIDKKLETLNEELVKKSLYTLEERMDRLEAKINEFEVDRKVKERLAGGE